MDEKTEEKLDDAVEEMNEVLGGLLDEACGWFVGVVQKIRDRKKMEEEIDEEYHQEDEQGNQPPGSPRI